MFRIMTECGFREVPLFGRIGGACRIHRVLSGETTIFISNPLFSNQPAVTYDILQS